MLSYDKYLDAKNSRLAIGTDVFLDWNLNMDECLFYGDEISIFTHLNEVNVKFREKSILMLLDSRTPVDSFNFQIREKLNIHYPVIRVNDALFSPEEYFQNSNGLNLKGGEDIFIECINLNVKYEEKVAQLYFENVSSLAKQIRDQFNIEYPMIRDEKKLITLFLYFKNWAVKKYLSKNTEICIENIKNPEIFVQTLDEKMITIDGIRFTDTIEDLKRLIHNIDGAIPDEQRLIFDGMQLEDSRTLSDYNIQNGSILDMVLRLKGGGGLFSDSSKKGAI